MKYFLIYDVANKSFVSNIVCTNRKIANKWCDFLESVRKTEFVPVRFVDGIQKASI